MSVLHMSPARCVGEISTQFTKLAGGGKVIVEGQMPRSGFAWNFRDFVTKSGYRGLYRGVGAAVFIAPIGSGAAIVGVEYVKKMLDKY